jgi:hypothetical protein
VLVMSVLAVLNGVFNNENPVSGRQPGLANPPLVHVYRLRGVADASAAA